MDSGKTAGVSLVLSPEDPLLELNLETRPTSVMFSREMLRIGKNRNLDWA